MALLLHMSPGASRLSQGFARRGLAWWLDFCILLLGTWGLCNSWGLAVLCKWSFWWSSARGIACSYVYTIREDSRSSRAQVAHLQELRALTELLSCVPSCHIGGNYYSFSNYLSYSTMAPFRCCRGAPCPLNAEGSWVTAITLPRPSFLFFSPVCLPFPFSGFWTMPPFKKPIDFFF